MKEATKKRIMDTKWRSLEKRGFTRPKTSEENKQRIRAAHGQ
jgi:hypothetical protein